MLQGINFELSRGYLFKTILVEKEHEMDNGIVRRILLELSSVDGDKIECYHGCLPSSLSDPEMIFDYLIMYKIGDGFKPIVIKNGRQCHLNPSELFEEYYKEYKYLHFDCCKLLEFICESSKMKFHEFLKEKYSDFVNQDVLFF